ncbi:hypothetical protein [Terribacillus sp. DMT04]|uniref:hypothetical protein n=1 Tax=Terribacillus sp. DMT04 TaxID=2850441 RepID=UPI001C2C7006|nr:hypothetical protein [Terribacillus sp. DMT04]QXE00640.1 hypothetical protein KS242_11485 [Terribacillus sp. DMT04]
MEIQVIQDLEKELDWVKADGNFEHFHIVGVNDDYVEDTKLLMQKAVSKCFKYPLYIHFEGYDDIIDSVLLKRNKYKIEYRDTGRKVLTMSVGKTYRAKIPSFTITVPSENILKSAFTHWFHLAQENNMWLITQYPISYRNKFAAVDMTKESTILLADHDAQSLSIVTNDPLYQGKENVRVIFEK